jgi:uncharacterized protein (DUF1015 family)
MADVRAFAGLRYAREVEARVAPPYDVLDEAGRAALAREPENLVHVTMPAGPAGERDYAGAGERLRAWLRDGVLVADAEPTFYVVEERIAGGRVRRGFFAAVRLADYSERVIRPHERTMAGPKQDRLLLTRAVRANLEPLFFLYEDRTQVLAGAFEKALHGPLLASFRGPDGTQIRMAALRDGAAIEAIQAFLMDRPLVIADGHHRYETMLRYRDEQREQGSAPSDAPSEFVLAYMVNAFDSGSRIQAIHRLVHGEIAEPRAALQALGFAVEPLPLQRAGEVIELLARRAPAEHAFALAAPGGTIELAVRPRGPRLDVEVLHEEVLPALGGTLSFDATPERVLAALQQEKASLGIFMHPLDADSLFRTVEAGQLLPQKSTFFSPKIPGGLVLRTLDEG